MESLIREGSIFTFVVEPDSSVLSRLENIAREELETGCIIRMTPAQFESIKGDILILDEMP